MKCKMLVNYANINLVLSELYSYVCVWRSTNLYEGKSIEDKQTLICIQIKTLPESSIYVL